MIYHNDLGQQFSALWRFSASPLNTGKAHLIGPTLQAVMKSFRRESVSNGNVLIREPALYGGRFKAPRNNKATALIW